MNSNNEYNFLLDKFYKSKDTKYLGLLFIKYSRLVFGVCNNYLKNKTKAEDATQEIYIKFQKYMLTSNTERIRVVESFIRTITVRYCIDLLRKEKQNKTIQLETNETYFDYLLFVELSNPQRLLYYDKNDNDIIEKKINQLLLCMKKLNYNQRESIYAFYFKNYKYNVIAQELKCSIKNVKSYIQNGKRNLAICINKSPFTDSSAEKVLF